MSERTAVYRLFDTDDVLLYVGISNHFGQRWEQHAKVQPWWPEVQRQTVEWHPSREEALAAEKAAIQAEYPRFNIMHVSPAEKVHAGCAANLEQKPIAEARTDLSGLASQVKFGRRMVYLTRRDKPAAAVVPTELGDEAELAGGADAAIELLRRARAEMEYGARYRGDKQ